MKKLFTFLFLLSIAYAQNSYVLVEAQFDSYGPEESEFYIQDVNGNIVLQFAPTVINELYVDTLWLEPGAYTAVLIDTYGDGWLTNSVTGYFRLSNHCDGVITEFICSSTNFFEEEVTNFNIGPCNPNAPPPPPPLCNNALVQINLDQYPGETTWQISDTSGVVLFSNGPYDGVPSYQPQEYNICLPVGELTFTINDVYGDGLAGSLWGGTDGSYYVLQCGDTLVDGSVANFGTDSTHTFTSDTCVPPPPIPGCMNEDYLEFNSSATVSDSSCATLKIYGCTDETMFNYDSLANTMSYIDSCEYTLVLNDLLGNGWVGSNLAIIQNGDVQNFSLDSGYTESISVWLQSPSPVTIIFDVVGEASATVTECGFGLYGPQGDTIVHRGLGWVIPFYPYTGVTNCGNYCEEITYGCLDSTAYNYDNQANTEDICYYNPGCMLPAYVEYYDQGFVADISDGSCNEIAIFGCLDSTMYNYNPIANVTSGGCVEYIYGCMDPLMFNYEPNATAPDTCITYLYGCLEPTAFNYCNECNTDNGSCIDVINGCTDSTALNYDLLANTNNGSCIYPLPGCTDATAINYNIDANMSDSSCYYSAGCAVGDIYYIPNECFSWVIEVDPFCCDNEWDNTCQELYTYCLDGWTGPTDITEFRNSLVIYPNPTSDYINVSKKVDAKVFNVLGKLILSKKDINVLDVSKLQSGMYNVIFEYNNVKINKRIIKQ